MSELSSPEGAMPCVMPTATKHTRDGAADYLKKRYGFRCSPSYLANLATQGKGPRYYRAGRSAIYIESDLDRWAASQISPSHQ